MRDLIREFTSSQLRGLIFGLFFAGSTLGQLNQDMELTVKADSTVLRRGSPFEVALTITNRSEKLLEVGSNIHLVLDDGTTKAGGTTMANGSYWAPLSATYRTAAAGCQSDLDNDRVRREGPAVVIYPSKKITVLKKEERFEFRVDAAKVCWAHRISSTYPHEDVFSTAKPGKYSLFASLSIQDGTREVDGTSVPISRSIDSNKLDITLSW